jgi:hypothetical protein
VETLIHWPIYPFSSSPILNNMITVIIIIIIIIIIIFISITFIVVVHLFYTPT